jgi:hypothetical protein
LAAAYDRHDEMEDYARQVESAMPWAQVTSTWHRAGPAEDVMPDDDLAAARAYAEKDLADLLRSDALVLFTGGGRGGSLVEFGCALGLGLRTAVVGRRVNIFLANSPCFANFGLWLAAERAAGGTAADIDEEARR